MKTIINDKDSFRILMMSDIQERADFGDKTRMAMEYLLDNEKPDLVILGGDNCFGPDIHSTEELRLFLDQLTGPMEKRGIRWAHIFGNHDHDVRCVSAGTLQEMYENYAHCVSGHVDGIHGNSNYYIDIKGNDGKIQFRIWCLDSNGSLEDSEMNHIFPEKGFRKTAVLPSMPGNNDRYDIIYFDQLSWYYAESIKLEKEAGRKVDGIMFLHIAPEEFSLARENPLECRTVGWGMERLAPAAFNSGLFSLLVQRGDVKVVAAGHTHMNSYAGEYCGILMCYDACTGYTSYGVPDMRGGRIFDLDTLNGTIKTKMINTTDAIPF